MLKSAYFEVEGTSWKENGLASILYITCINQSLGFFIGSNTDTHISDFPNTPLQRRD